MIRFLNFVQGLFSLSVVAAYVLGWPVKWAMIGILVPIIISSFIVMVLREETPKGKVREGVELLFGLTSIVALLGWAFIYEVSLETTTPFWLMVLAWPSVIINLGYGFAWISYLLARFFDFVKKILEIFSGETIGR